MMKPKLTDPKNLLINGKPQDRLTKKAKIKATGKRLEQIMFEAQKQRGIKL